MNRFYVTLLAFVFLGFSGLHAQDEDRAINNGFGFGMQLSQIQKDFGIGLNLTSPTFANNRIAVRLRGNFMFNENIQDLETTWTSYSHLSLGLVGISGYIGNQIRLYGEGGVIGLFPSEEFSAEDLVLGGYGLFGFEFFMQKNFNYFIEIGGVGSGASADRIAFDPIYSNGLSISVGFRFNLK